MTTCFHGEAILPNETLSDCYVVCEDGRIVGIDTRRPRNVTNLIEGRYIAPGYVDLHVHGGAGSDYMDGSVDAVLTANRAHARHGTTTLFPTTTTGSTEEIARMLDACASVQANWSPADGARIGGVHYYGPYFAADKVDVTRPKDAAIRM